MKLPTLRRNRTDALPGIVGTVRADRRTHDLVRRLRPGDIAVIDHPDIDRHSAEALVDAGVAVVVNATESVTGSYPNLGPGIIAAAGIPLVDNIGDEAYAQLRDGETIRVDDATLYCDTMPIAEGEVLDRRRIDQLIEWAKEGMTAQLEAFTANTAELLRRERELLLDGVGIPEVKTRFAGRHALVVARGYDYREDLAGLKAYIREYHPVLVGVEEGADVLREAGYKPDLIVGAMSTVSEDALKGGAELVVHSYRDGKAAGFNRLERLGLHGVAFPGAVADEDIAMLLADACGADLIVAVGTHTSLVEFMDRGKTDMSSSYLTRVRLGSKLIDANGVRRLHHTRIRMWQLMLLLLAGLLAVGVSIGATPAGQGLVDGLEPHWNDFTDLLQGLIS